MVTYIGYFCHFKLKFLTHRSYFWVFPNCWVINYSELNLAGPHLFKISIVQLRTVKGKYQYRTVFQKASLGWALIFLMRGFLISKKTVNQGWVSLF